MTDNAAKQDEMLGKADELAEIADGMRDLLDRARTVLRGTGIIGQRAEAYWLGHLQGFLDDENRYDITINDTIRELSGTDEDD